MFLFITNWFWCLEFDVKQSLAYRCIQIANGTGGRHVDTLLDAANMLFTPDLHEVIKFPGGAIQSSGYNELTRLNIALYGSSPYKPSRMLRAVCTL